MAEESHTEPAVFRDAPQTPPSSSSSGSSISSSSGSQSGSLNTDITSPSHSPKQRGANAGTRGVSASDEVERYLMEFKNGEVTPADMFVFISSLTEMLSHLGNIPSNVLDVPVNASSPLQQAFLHVKIALLENLASPPFEQTLIQNQISIFENWIRVLVNSSFAVPSDASGYRRQHQWMRSFRALDFLQWVVPPSDCQLPGQDILSLPQLGHRFSAASIPESEGKLWTHFEKYNPFLIFSSQFGCNFLRTAGLRGGPAHLDITIVNILTLDEVPMFVVEAARKKLPHLPLRYSKGALHRLCHPSTPPSSLPPPPPPPPADSESLYRDSSIVRLPRTIPLPGESLSPLITDPPRLPSSFYSEKDGWSNEWKAHVLDAKSWEGLHGTLGCYLKADGQMYALTAGHCCHIPSSPSSSYSHLSFPLQVQSPSEKIIKTQTLSPYLTTNKSMEIELMAIWEDRMLGSVDSSAFKDMTNFDEVGGPFLDYAAIKISRKCVTPLENIFPILQLDIHRPHPIDLLMSTRSLLKRGDQGIGYFAFDKAGPLPDTDSTVFYCGANGRGWSTGTIIAHTQLVWIGNESTDNRPLSPSLGSRAVSRGNVAIMQSASDEHVGRPGESGSIVFVERDEELIAVGLLFGAATTLSSQQAEPTTRYALVQSLEDIIVDLKRTIPDICLPCSPVV
ncbi:hypothetical protein EV421DRAFT_2040092 [Armillaria borealis]|uniref:Uncharacterized protein n=1 Tax=Armillaria borealis TaxID=47425 RepID=A0AA39J1L9_9AGAR|nr:hypothetical protein EV421DRAFT_2040092 [Armillaria borealis]